MNALLWKDFRLIRAPIVAAVLLTIGSYLVMGTAWWQGELGIRFDEWHALDQWGGLADAAWVGLCCTAFMAAVFVAVLFDGERRDGSAVFLATLPVPRWKLALSKVMTGALAVGAMWLTNFLIRLMPSGQMHESIWSVLTDIASPTAATLMLFGSTVLLAMFVTSPTIAASLSCAALYCCILIFQMLPGHVTLRFPSWNEARSADLLILLGIGAATFLIGITHYLRRVEP